MTQLQNNGVHVTQLAAPTGTLCEKEGSPMRLYRVNFGGVR